MGKKKVPTKFRQKAMLERQSKERKASAPSKGKINWKQFLRKLPGKISKFFRGVIHELKRVTWPTRKELLTYTIVSIITIAFFAIILGIFDWVFLRLVGLLKGF